MGCTRCGTDTRLISLMFNKLMDEALDDGKLQAGLVSCDKDRLEKNTRVVTCESLSQKVCDLIESGELCIITPAALSAKTNANDPDYVDLALIMSDGSTLDTKFKVGGLTKKAVSDMITEAIKPYKEKIEALETKAQNLQAQIDAIPQHVAGIELTDATGNLVLAHGHETENM